MDVPHEAEDFPQQGRIAGVDFGSVRIGLALCDPERRFASPCQTYTRRNAELDRRYFQQFVADHDIRGFVVGLPIHTSGAESQKSAEARRFAAWLKDATGLPCVLFDERYSTVQAEELLRAGPMTSKKRRQRIDKIAAQIILTAFLERATPPSGQGASGQGATPPSGTSTSNLGGVAPSPRAQTDENCSPIDDRTSADRDR